MNKSLVVLALTSLACLTGIPAGAQQRDGAVIQNSGSTNFPGYTIKVWSDGSAWGVATRHGATSAAPTTGKIPLQLATEFFDELAAAKRAGELATRACMKSASFGTSIVIRYHDWTTPDLSCPGGAPATALTAQANQIAAILNLSGRGQRTTPMLPNEHRRPPVEGISPSQASASPEPSPSAS